MNAWLDPLTGHTPQGRLNEWPDRVPAATAVIIVAAVVITAVVLLGTAVPAGPPWGLLVLGALTVAAIADGRPAAVHATALSLLLVLTYEVPETGPHPFPLVMALAGYAIVVLASPRLRETAGWLHSGSVQPAVERLCVDVAAASCVGLLLWFWLAADELEVAVLRVVDVPLWALVPVALFFALVNAGAEEAVFRGVLLDVLHSAVGVPAAVVGQAVVFGMAHVSHGVPSGVWGGVLSGAYGLLLGVVRVRARGMLAVWAVHAATDLVLFTLLVYRIR